MLYIPIYVVVPIRIHQDSKTPIQPCTAYMPWHMNQNTGYSVQRIMYDKSIYPWSEKHTPRSLLKTRINYLTDKALQ